MNNIEKDSIVKFMLRQYELTPYNFMAVSRLTNLTKIYTTLTGTHYSLGGVVHLLVIRGLVSYAQCNITNKLGYRLNQEKTNEYLNNSRQDPEGSTS